MSGIQLAVIDDIDTGDRQDRRDLRLCAGRDVEAFERLYRKYAARLYGLACRMLPRRDAAEDVVQEAFLQAFRNAAGFRGESAVGTWLYGIAVNGCRMWLRAERRRPAVPLGDLDVAGRPLEEPYAAERLEAALAQVDGEARELLLLSAHGHSYEAIARMTELTPQQVRGRLYRARKGLQQLLGR